jgi:hypothetical protein
MTEPYTCSLEFILYLVELSLCKLIKHYATKTWGSGGIAPPIMTSALEGDEWSASRFGRVTPWERAPGTHWIGRLVGIRACLDDMEKRKILPLPGIDPGRPARSPSLYRLSYSDSRIYVF